MSDAGHPTETIPIERIEAMNERAHAIPEISDIQSSQDTRRIDIDRVGIKDIRHPVVVRDRSGREQHTVASFNMYVGLPHNFKGTHMSRFVEILNHHEYEITVESFKRMMAEMSDLLHAKVGHIEMTFPYFVMKAAPVSGVKSLIDYDVTFIGRVQEGVSSIQVKVVVPITTLCPCSKDISDYGAHNQRSHVTVLVRIRDFLWIEEIIDIVEIGRVLRALWAPQAPRREIRHGARLRQPEVRRGHRARRRRAPQ